MESSKNFYSDSIVFLEHKISVYQQQLSHTMLEKCNFIIEVGFLTVSVNENNNIILENLICPVQFTQEGVDKILEANFTNSEGTIKPVVYFSRDWYSNRLQECENSLELLKSQSA